jgi:hypothetical protein
MVPPKSVASLPDGDQPRPDIDEARDDDGMLASTRARLAFQLRAAGILAESARLVAAATALFRSLYRTAAWSQTDTEAAVSWVRAGRELSRDWERLQPPTQLRHHWKVIALHLRGLNRLFEDPTCVGNVVGEERLKRAVRLQAAFNSHLRTMSRTEWGFHEQERELHGT